MLRRGSFLRLQCTPGQERLGLFQEPLRFLIPRPVRFLRQIAELHQARLRPVLLLHLVPAHRQEGQVRGNRASAGRLVELVRRVKVVKASWYFPTRYWAIPSVVW